MSENDTSEDGKIGTNKHKNVNRNSIGGNYLRQCYGYIIPLRVIKSRHGPKLACCEEGNRQGLAVFVRELHMVISDFSLQKHFALRLFIQSQLQFSQLSRLGIKILKNYVNEGEISLPKSYLNFKLVDAHCCDCVEFCLSSKDFFKIFFYAITLLVFVKVVYMRIQRRVNIITTGFNHVIALHLRFLTRCRLSYR